MPFAVSGCMIMEGHVAVDVRRVPLPRAPRSGRVAAPIVTQMILGTGDAVEEQVAEDGDEQAAGAGRETDFTSLDPAIYVPLDPPLLASFEAPDGNTRYLQMSIQIMGRKQSAMDAVRQHAPAIRINADRA